DSGGEGGRDEEVWPPSAIETQTRYRRVRKLQSPHLAPGRLVDRVLCFPFYETIVNQLGELGFRDPPGPKRLVQFAYDWRQDNFHTADLLARRLDALHDQGARRFNLIGHSMGGIVARLLLESGRYDSRPWFVNIRLFVALATPHLGAPLALGRIFGVDATLGLSGADFAALAANEDYPSGYQLMPAPGEAAIWSRNSAALDPLDPYDEATAIALGMKPALVDKAAAVHAALSAGRRPGQVRYVYFAGTGHRTATRANVVFRPGQPVDHRRTVLTLTPDGGDGTVPIYSALPHVGQRQIVVNEHATVFAGAPFRKVFFRLLGGDDGDAIEAAGRAAAAGLRVALSLDRPVQQAGRDIEATLSIQNLDDPLGEVEPARIETIEGELALDAMSDAGEPGETVARHPVRYAGPPADRLTVLLPPAPRPGLYRLRFEGDPAALAPAPFAVGAA
ncbi:MAG: esterase/lipase family protein, partial [Rubrimonas sp.]